MFAKGLQQWTVKVLLRRNNKGAVHRAVHESEKGGPPGDYDWRPFVALTHKQYCHRGKRIDDIGLGVLEVPPENVATPSIVEEWR